jgi:predicted RNase H-like HicB family nuclease
VGQTTERVVYPFTFVFTQEDGEWSALACEVDVASCGSSLDEARKGLEEAIELYLGYMIGHGLSSEIERPVPRDDLVELWQGNPTIERHALIVDIITYPVVQLSAMEFVRSALTPADCRPALV